MRYNGLDMSQVEIYLGWCKKCGICAAFCPQEALEVNQDGYPFLKDAQSCNGCGLCELRCPDFAIVVLKDEEEQKEAGSSPRQ